LVLGLLQRRYPKENLGRSNCVRNEKRSTRARTRGPDEPQRYETGDLNAYDTLYRSVLPEYPNLSEPEFCARSGAADCVRF